MSLMISRRSDARRLNQLIDEAFTGWPFVAPNWSAPAAWVPATDVFENQEGIKIVTELPGIDPAQVNLTLENNVLTIRGEKQQAAEEQTTKVHRYERSYGSFERAFTVPSTVDADKVEAKFEHGVLTVTLPKAERAKARQIPVAGK